MIKHGKASLLALALGALMVLGGCSSGQGNGTLTYDSNTSDHDAKGKQGNVVTPLTKTNYFLGEKITIAPKDLSYEGKVYPCTGFYLLTPTGQALSGKTHILNEAGRYEIVYYAETRGLTITAEEVINVYQKGYSVGKESSSTEFVDAIMMESKKPVSGIRTRLVEGDEWTYNQIVDISGSDLQQPIIKYYWDANSELADHMSLDALKSVVKITDFYDPSNYVEVYTSYFNTNTSTGRMQQFVVAGASNQQLSGCDLKSKLGLKGSRRSVVIDGTEMNCVFGTDDFGAATDTKPGGKSEIVPGRTFSPDISNSDNRGYSVFFESSSNRIYLKHDTVHFVTDLDEPGIYDNNLFKGFTTGEVIISVRFESYNESSVLFEVSEINGIKGEDLNLEIASDEKAPIIRLDNEANDFYIAKDAPFKIFGAAAMDPHLYGGVKAEVYYDYATAGQRYVKLEDDGTFIPRDVGSYSIVYTASDTFGNLAKKVVRANAVNVPEGQVVSLSYEKVESAKAGSVVSFPAHSISGYNGGLHVKMHAVYEDGSLTEINPSDPKLLLKRVGTYKIVYVYGDAASTYESEYELESLASDNAYLETQYLPKYLIKGTSVSLDENKTISCLTKEIRYVDSDVYAAEDGGEYGAGPIDRTSYQVDASSSVRFKYVHEGVTIFESEPIEVMDVSFVENLDMSKYFKTSGSVLASQECLTMKTSSDDAFEFINPLSWSLMRLDIDLGSKEGYSSFRIAMEDYYGEAPDFTLDFYYVSGILNVKINGGISLPIADTTSILLSYDVINGVMGFGSGASTSIGLAFPKDRLYLSMSYRGNAGESSFRLRSINNQNMNDMKLDMNAPQISYRRLRGNRSIGECVTIDETFVCDVLSPYLEANHKLSVLYRNEDMSVSRNATSADGVKLDGKEKVNRAYDLLLSDYGTYILSYAYEDQAYAFGELSPNKTNIPEVIYVTDETAPSISIDGIEDGAIVKANLNDVVTVRSASVTDDHEASLTVYVFNPMGAIEKVENGKFTAKMKGDYRVVYYAIDSYNNVAIASYIVRV